MGRIQSSIGLITGTPIEDTVNKLLAISAQPRDRLSTKVKGLQSQATSFSELTALVVGVQLAAGRFSDTKLFSGTKVTSSNDAALGVTKTGTPTAGDTAIRVLQLAQTHVVSSDSFASSSAALGQSGTLEVRSQGFIDSSKELKELNGGQGVQAGQIRITDRSGGTATIDISSARTVDDVLDAINQSSTVRVKARVDGDRFVIDDVSGGSGLLKISEVGSRHTAADLGFSNVAVSSNSVTGGDVLRLANATKVNSLRDGLGIGFNQSGNDLSITFRDGSTLDVDFSNFSRAAAVSTGTTNNSSPNGKLTISTSATGGADDGVQVVFVNDNSITQGNEQVELVNSGGAKKLVFRIDEGATTADDLVTALSGNSTLSSRFTAVAGGDGTGTIATTDTTTLAGGAAIAATKAPTLDDVLRVLNQASPSKLQAKIAASGDSIQLTDLTAGVGNFTIANSSGSTAASDLGLATSVAANTVTGTGLSSGLRSVRLESLAKVGASALGTLQITTRDGNTGNVDLSSAKTVQDVINLLDNSGLEISADYNSAGTGLQIRDLSGGTSSEFSISSGDDTADRLGIKTSTVDTVVQGEGLDRKFISRSTLLSDLNQGRGVALGSFRITDTTGAAASVNLSSASATTVGEVIDAINNAGLAVQAKINTKGDGIEIIDTAEAGGTLSVADLSNGTSAKDLRILGTGTRQTIDGSLKTAIDGSQVDRILVEATDSLDTIVSKIAAQAKLASASVVGSGSDFRLQIASARGGEIGRLAIDTTGLNLGLRTDQIGQDAIIQAGANSTTATYYRSRDGVFDNVISGVSLTAKQVTSQTTTVKVASDNESLVTATTTFVDQYNKLMDKIKALTFFDEQAQSTGLLFGSKETLQIQRSFERLVTGRFSVTGKLKSLQSIGVTVDDTGKLSFSNSKLRDQIASDPNGVKELLSNSTSGLQKKVDELAERIAGENNSTLILKSQSITAQIEFSNKRIDEMTARLDLEKERMLNQFYAMEAIIGKLQGNQQYVSKIASLSSS